MSTMIVCAKCGQERPLTMYDRRFIGKGTRLTCSPCRGYRDEEEKWRLAADALRVTPEQQAARERWRREWQERQTQEQLWEAQRREREARQQMLRAKFTEYGITDHGEQVIIERVAERLGHRNPQGWAILQRAFYALDPPFISVAEKWHIRRKKPPRISQAVREQIYVRQEGRCYYCERELLPLEVWRHGPDGRSDVTRLSFEERRDGAIDAAPELDHKTPLSRGGAHTPDNLVYACNVCNQRKGVRTEAEFRAYPDDAITRLPMDPMWIDLMIQVVRKYPWLRPAEAGE